MIYLITFFEGIITFVSPCLLPMIPIYISYFAGNKTESDSQSNRKNTLVNALGFVLGFTLVFVMLGALANIFSRILIKYSRIVNIICGIIMIIFGLNYVEIFQIKFLNQTKKIGYTPKMKGFFSAFLFGIVFAVGWSPCVGTFLGAALMMAASSTDGFKGIVMLICFSAGLGIPFVLSALIIQKLGVVFDFVKKHNRKISIISGIFLILIGISMITGHFGRLLNVISVI